MTRLIAALVLGGLLGLAVVYGVVRYQACRRVFPIWYCLGPD